MAPAWLHPDRPFAPRRLPFFYGWVIVVAATIGIVMSIPGQTMGVSVFTDFLIDATGLSRLALSNAYLVGTFASGVMLPFGGRWLDRLGVRVTALASAAVLAATLVFLASVDRTAARVADWLGVGVGGAASALLVVGFTSLRFSGQGMLTMSSRTMLGKWWDRRRGQISGISGVFVAFGFASAPLLLHAWIEAVGWRGAWWGMAAVVGLAMGGIAGLLFRDNPEECGLTMDGAEAPEATGPVGAEVLEEHALGRAAAVRTLSFWAVTSVLANQSLVITAVTFHIVDIGAESGLSADAAVAIFLPVAVVSTTGGYLVGLAVDRFALRGLVVANAAFQVVAFAALAHLGDPVLRALAIGFWGASSSFFGPLSVAALPRLFGRRHLGAISSVQMMVLVVASAVGPSVLALSRQALGSYAPALYACCGLPLASLVLGLAMRERLPSRAWS